jgi:NAD(P)-dependent dehydrogenase (short-subunit alcohol dehydrogenase family)
MSSAIYPGLKGRTVIVTGGASGIGDSIVRAFLSNGSKVVIIDIQDDAAKAQAEDLKKAGLDVPLYRHCDLMDIPAVEKTMEEIRKTAGPASVLVNNAANDTRVAFEDVTVENFDRSMNVNLRHFFFTARAVSKQMKELGGGSIVNMSSGAWVAGLPNLQGYSAAKAAIVGLTNSLARQLGEFKIRVNAIGPGMILTERQLRLWITPEAIARGLDRQCIHERVEPTDIADAVVFFASDASRMITKQILFVNGGS